MTRIMETKSRKMYTLTDDIIPAIIIHPGEVLGEEIKARGFSQKEFAEKAGMQATHLSAIIHGVRNITPSVAKKLEAALEGISAEFWTKFQEDYNRNTNRRRLQLAHMVAGYGESMPVPAGVLAESNPTPYGGYYSAIVRVPEKDKALLDKLAERLGWRVEY